MGALNGHLLPHWPQPVLPDKQRSPTWAAPLHLQRSPPFWSHNPECFWAPKWMIQPNLSLNGGMPYFYITGDTIKECIMKIWMTRCYCCHCSDGIDSLGAHLKHWWRSSKRLTHGTSGKCGLSQTIKLFPVCSHMLQDLCFSLFPFGKTIMYNIYNSDNDKNLQTFLNPHFSWNKLIYIKSANLPANSVGPEGSTTQGCHRCDLPWSYWGSLVDHGSCHWRNTTPILVAKTGPRIVSGGGPGVGASFSSFSTKCQGSSF